MDSFSEVLPWLSEKTLTAEDKKNFGAASAADKTKGGSGSSKFDDENSDPNLASTLDREKNQIMKRRTRAEGKKVVMLLKACGALLPKGGTDSILRLTNDEQYLRAEECMIVAEKYRRSKITSDLYYCQLLFDGRFVGKALPKSLDILA